MSHILVPHNILPCTEQAIGYKTNTDVDDTSFQHCKNDNNKKASCTITAATMHFYLLYNWIIFFICHARTQKAFSWLIPWHNLKETRNVIRVITSVPRTTCSLEYLFKLTWLLSVVICFFCFLKECMCLHDQVPNTPQS